MTRAACPANIVVIMSDGTSTEPTENLLDRSTVEAALAVAVRAPSIHNTQPWAWRLDRYGLTLLADRSRQLAVADPDGHSMLVSCGAALHLTELGLRAAGWRVETSLLPDPGNPDVLAHFRPLAREDPDETVLAAADAALQRRSDRRPFAAQNVSEVTIEKGQDAEILLFDLP